MTFRCDRTTAKWKPDICGSQIIGNKVRVAVTWPKNMLHDAGMAGLAKLHRSVVWNGQSPVRAVHVGRGEIAWQDRCDAANGSKEPKVTKSPK